MKLLRAFTAIEQGIPTLVFETPYNPPFYVDVFQKQSLVDAGVVIVFGSEEDVPLRGFETVSLQVYPDDPASFLVIEPTDHSAACSEPLVLEITQRFLESTNNGTFEHGIQVYPFSGD